MVRILDANLNRLGEGLRVLEDILRYELDCPEYETLRIIRHQLKDFQCFKRDKLLDSRDSVNDLGNKAFASEMMRKDLKHLLTANFKRTQESARVLEEVLKLEAPSESSLAKKIRYALYQAEKDIFAKLKARIDLRLYLVTDSRLNQIPLAQVVRQAIAGGVTCVQLREKHLCDKEIIALGQQVLPLCREHKVPLIIDDRVDLVLALDADGVHLGQKDMEIDTARKILGQLKIIGKSTHSIEQVKQALCEDIDYLAFGPLFATPTKNYAPVGLQLVPEVQALAAQKNIPLVFIGGITGETIAEVKAAGIKSMAVVREIMGSQNPLHSAANLLK
jgi:thiamine-phosphate pyrophosphorylase